jgi:hypothetical protein
VHAYTLEGWGNFFLAVVGAAAALTGLVFVALSINLSRILAIPGLPGRAAETICLLVAALVLSLVALVPQSHDAFTVELIVLSVLAWCAPVTIQIREARRWRTEPSTAQERSWLWGRVFLTQLPTILPIVAGVSLALGAGGGLYWLAAGVILLLVDGIINAWVLVVEILR